MKNNDEINDDDLSIEAVNLDTNFVSGSHSIDRNVWFEQPEINRYRKYDNGICFDRKPKDEYISPTGVVYRHY